MSENKQAQAEEIKLTLDPEAEEQEAQKDFSSFFLYVNTFAPNF